MGTKCLFSTSHYLQTRWPNQVPPPQYQTSIEVVLSCKLVMSWVWVKHLSFCEFALNSIVAASTSKALFELFYSDNAMVLLDHLSGTTQLSL